MLLKIWPDKVFYLFYLKIEKSDKLTRKSAAKKSIKIYHPTKLAEEITFLSYVTFAKSEATSGRKKMLTCF